MKGFGMVEIGGTPPTPREETELWQQFEKLVEETRARLEKDAREAYEKTLRILGEYQASSTKKILGQDLVG
jgi:hypothetical protein